ncbi:MAG: hypothetical protein POELPBGB_03406 [Bacteroidia bacterium]|nr:hypothetical protein [Bacteroidia bacterium]
MEGRYSRFIGFLHFVGDILLLNVAFLIAREIRFGEQIVFNDQYRVLLIMFNLLWGIVAFGLRIYDIGRVTSLEKVVINLFKSIFLHAILIAAMIFSLKGYYYSRLYMLIMYIVFPVLLFGWRMLALYLLEKYRESGHNYRKVVIVGGGSVGAQVYQFFENNREHGYHFQGFFEDNPNGHIDHALVKGKVSAVPEFCRANGIDEIYCALPLNESEKIKELISFADNNMVRLRIVPDFRSFPYKRVNMDFYGSVPVLTIRKEPLENLFNRFTKRAFDIVFSLFVIVFLFSWMFPLIALAIKLTSKGPVFFKQLRSGKDNEEFYCYKFRTMKVNDKANDMQATKDDERITKVGRFLRKTSLDELPQFFNVLIGTMSVVGPRPHMVKHTAAYSAMIDKFMVRHFVQPGITGLAQVRGYRGEIKSPKDMEMRVGADVWYIENWSFLLDMKLIFLTVFNILKGDKKAY